MAWFNFSNKIAEQVPDKKNLNRSTLPQQLSRIKQDTQTWRDAIDESEKSWFPYRVKMQQLFNDTKLNGHVISCIEKRKDLILLSDFEILNKKGKLNEELTKSFQKDWLSRFISLSLDTLYHGYSLISLGDIQNNEFKNIQTVKRQNISPDREIVAFVPYSNSGFKFLDDLETMKYHVWVTTPNDIGTSKCGNGILYEVALYEIFLRNILGYNADFVELYSQPFRVGYTDKRDEQEVNDFEKSVASMGQNSYAILDSIGTERIEFVEAKNSGSAYLGYENLEKRLEAKISKIILGHADALDSTAGKLGATQGENSPSEMAIENKKLKDAIFIENVINGDLFPKLRDLGFNIPIDAVFKFKNNSEKEKRNFHLATLSSEIKKGGLQMSKDYFEEKTGVKLEEIKLLESKPDALTNSLKKLNAINGLYSKSDR